MIYPKWKTITGFEYYQVSPEGRVRSLDKEIITNNRWGKITYVIKGQELKPVKNKYGYFKVCLKKGKKVYNRMIHRLVAEAFLDNPYKKETVNHKDFNKGNNALENLEWVTLSENVKHGYENGRHYQKGEANNSSKLTEKIVLDIRKRREEGERAMDLAKEYGIHRCHVGLITRRGTWTHI